MELIIFTGIWVQLEDPANSAVRQNWDILVQFSKVRLNDQRYLPRASLEPNHLDQIERALDDPQDGVLQWLSRQP
jgi:hypothetical protein